MGGWGERQCGLCGEWGGWGVSVGGGGRKTKAPLDLILFGGGFCCPKVHGKNSSKIHFTLKGLENVK